MCCLCLLELVCVASVLVQLTEDMVGMVQELL